MRFFIIFVVIGLMSGCSTRPVPYHLSDPVPHSSLFDGYKLHSQSGDGLVRVVFVRDSGVYGSGMPAKLSIDGLSIARFWAGESIEIYLIPNSYIFAVEPFPRLGGAIVEREINISTDKSYAFRISLDGSGSFSLQQSTHLE